DALRIDGVLRIRRRLLGLQGPVEQSRGLLRLAVGGRLDGLEEEDALGIAALVEKAAEDLGPAIHPETPGLLLHRDFKGGRFSLEHDVAPDRRVGAVAPLALGL